VYHPSLENIGLNL